MPSLVAWLDASSEDQRRMREIVNLFSERESRDELGVGQVRDALSDTMFPGTSTLLTRARYLVLIPWCFVAAGRVGGTTDAITRHVEDFERSLISALKAEGDEEGLLGRVAGRGLKNLPSSLYWVALRQFGILSSPNLTAQDAIELGSPTLSEDDEGDGASWGGWSPSLPAVPAGFPQVTEGGFQLSGPEANWLRDRIREGSEGTLMAHLAELRPDADSLAPWYDSAAQAASGEPAVVLDHAQLFSFSMNGAALLYNLLLAERYEELQFDTINAPVEHYRERLAAWEDERSRLGESLAAWDRADFWQVVSRQNPHVAAGSRRFIDNWLDLVLATTDGIAANAHGREFITAREASHKRSQARLRNDKLLALWQGSSGAGALVFRWPQIQRILGDIHDGLERGDA